MVSPLLATTLLLQGGSLDLRVGFFLGGVLIAAVPVAVFGALALTLWRQYRRDRAEEHSGE